MRFTEKLAAHLTSEWRLQYINYEELKTLLTTAADKAPIEDHQNKRDVRTYYVSVEEEFLVECDKELQKINTFYAEKLAEATRKFVALKLQLEKYQGTETVRKKRRHLADCRIELPKRKLEHLKLAFSEFYLSLVLLQNYQNLNYTGFRKILKKHDKILRTDAGAVWFQKYIEEAFFYTNKDVLNFIHETEVLFTNNLEGGDRTRAMKRLRVPPLGTVHHPWTTFRLGFFSGIFLVLSIVIYMSFSVNSLSAENQDACLRLFRGPLLLVLFLYLIGINIFGWRAAGVNHVLIFELDPRDHITGLQVMEMAGVFGVLWAISVLAFLYHVELNVIPFLFPLLLLVMLLCFLLNPLRIFYFSSRFWLLRLIGRVITAPFHHVGFADFWLGDQLNSLVACLVDYEYTVCFYLSNGSFSNADNPYYCMEEDHVVGPVIRCLPAWFRFAQCLRRYRDTRLAYPFLVNAGKYATSFLVVYFGTCMSYYKDYYVDTFHNSYVWGYLISYTISTVYCYTWDLIKDFGVLQKCTGENIFLREQIVYAASFYYFSIVLDLFLRLLWVLAFFLIESERINAYNMSTICAVLEVFRRYIWNYFRLENEHLFNAGKFRAVRDISVAPIDAKDQIALQRMMDEMDGVKNRHSVYVDEKED